MCVLRLCFALLCCAGAVPSAFAGERPARNLLVLLADDVGVDAVACYGEGNDLPSTPNIDALAARGILFRNVWATPSCSPTRAMIQTGRHGFRTGVGAPVTGDGHGLPLSEVTLPELFDLHPELGYTHAYFGKWHLGSTQTGGILSPNVAGWGHYAGALDNLTQPWHYFHWPLVINGSVQVSDEYVTTKTVDLALDWLASAPEPWICFVSFHAAHYPLHAPPAHLHTVALPDGDPRETPRPFFRAIVEALDTEIGRLLASLGASRDRTSVFFASDNGTIKDVVVPPFLPERAKLTPYEGGIRVPLIVVDPLATDPGREVDHLVSLADLFAVIAESAGIDATATLPNVVLDARSFRPVLLDRLAPPARSLVYSEHFAPNGFDPGMAIRILRGPRYKLILRTVPLVAAELYDLARDPFEQRDLLSAPLRSAGLQAIYWDLRMALSELLR